MVRPRSHRVTWLVVLLLIATSAIQAGAATAKTVRISVNSAEVAGNGDSSYATISATGRFVAFVSVATNLVPGDANGDADVFVRDRREGTTRRISKGRSGVEANGASSRPSISADGRFVAFESDASNLVRRDTNGARDVFVYDRKTGVTRRVSRSSDGTQGNDDSADASISADGRFVAFSSEASNLIAADGNDAGDVFVRDLARGRTVRVSQGSAGTESNGPSHWPSISADGRFVAYVSEASNLVATDGNDASDIFIRDRLKRVTRRISIATGGAEGDGASSAPSISATGRHVAFDSDATNFGGDTNGYSDVFVRDRREGTTARVSMNSGSAVQGNNHSGNPSISADGRFVAFESDASSLTGGEDTNGFQDVFVRDLATGTTTRVSVNSAGTIQANDHSYWPAVSADGRFIVFESNASSLIEGDVNSHADIFIRGPMI